MYLVRARQLLTMPPSVPTDTPVPSDAEAIQDRDDQLVGLIEDGAIVIDETTETIQWVGPWNERPKKFRKDSLDLLETDVAMPGLIDCHTHAVFAGERSREFMLRNAGQSYVEILEAGGGILNSVDALRAASLQSLTATLIPRVLHSVRQGITTLEIKSGYGLTVDDELKSLRAIANASPEVPCELVPCFLGAHAVPREHRDHRDRYIDLVCDQMIPAVADQQLAGYCDVFCDRGAFTADEARRILQTGKDHGLIPRIHADEIADIGAVQMACDIGAASADHLEHTGPEAIAAMADAGVVAVLMPAVNLFLGTTDHLAPARALLDAGCDVALATDFNPGSAMTQDLGAILMLAATLYKLTPAETLRAVTVAAARALRRDNIGSLQAGHRADIACFNAPHYRYLPYHFGQAHTDAVIYRGNLVYWTDSADVEID